MKGKVLVAQLCPTLCDPVDCSPPDSSVHGIIQARILEWVAMPSSRGSFRPGNESTPPTLQADSLLSETPHIFFMVLGERGSSRGSEELFHYQVLNFGS